MLEAALQPLGFFCHRLRFEEPGTPPVENLYARLGSGAPHFCFAGHSDVVPPGEGWAHDPFAATIVDDTLFGRGAADMKSARWRLCRRGGARGGEWAAQRLDQPLDHG